MKKFLSVLLAAALLLSCSEDRSKYLKVYNWGDYIDEDLLEEFEQWYEEQTGESVEVIYQTFDINETMLSKIEKGHEDYDVVCPSDYIVERMLQKDLLLPINREFGDTPDYIASNIAPYMYEMFLQVNAGKYDPSLYAVPYMWGTSGLLYNTKYVTEGDVSTWAVLKDDRFIDKIFVKDAPRDIYGPILMYLKQDGILDGSISRDSLMYDSSDESLAMVEEYMTDMRHRVAGWEADFGKEQMTQEKGWLNFTWSGDAVWAIREAAEVGVPLKYAVPREGANVWFDAWVIPKYSGNPKAASYFIDFLCRTDVAIRNMDFIGYVSAVCGDEILEAMSSEEDYPETVDVSYFFGTEATAEHLDPTQYPDISVIGRCSMSHDWGDKSDKLIAMWSRVKGNQLSWWTILVDLLTVILLVLTRLNKFFHIRRRRR